MKLFDAFLYFLKMAEFLKILIVVPW